jgi:Na+/H+ antiporter NhaD/arsenite permease-like protein
MVNLKLVQSIATLINEIIDVFFFFKGFLIAVAYSAAIGGLGTLVGTGPNIFVKGYADE